MVLALRRSGSLIDLVEKCLVALFSISFTAAYGRDFIATGNYADLAQIATEGSIVVFVLIRRSTTDISHKPVDWAFAWGATLLGLAARPIAGHALAPVPVSTVVMTLGFVLQMWAKLTLRRSFGIVAANRGVRDCGPYRYLRHPMYSGYFLIYLGALTANASLWNAFVFSAATILQVQRVIAEERVLSLDPVYRAFKTRVRYRVVPGVF
jgi:protein-S-isoprenylcysteine O-methyltransferase Ste14